MIRDLKTQGRLTPDDDDRGTPDELFRRLDAEFRFDLDAAASHANAKCTRYYTTDGLYERTAKISQSHIDQRGVLGVARDAAAEGVREIQSTPEAHSEVLASAPFDVHVGDWGHPGRPSSLPQVRQSGVCKPATPVSRYAVGQHEGLCGQGPAGRALHTGPSPNDALGAKARNGLTGSWEGARVFCNPPFSEIASWVAKAWASKAELVVMLLPACRTDQAWWHEYVEPMRDLGAHPGFCGFRLRTRFLKGRTRFTKAGTPMGSPKFGCVLLIWESAK